VYRDKGKLRATVGRKVTGSSKHFPAKTGKEKDSLTAEDV